MNSKQYDYVNTKKIPIIDTVHKTLWLEIFSYNKCDYFEQIGLIENDPRSIFGNSTKDTNNYYVVPNFYLGHLRDTINKLCNCNFVFDYSKENKFSFDNISCGQKDVNINLHTFGWKYKKMSCKLVVINSGIKPIISRNIFEIPKQYGRKYRVKPILKIENVNYYFILNILDLQVVCE